MKRRQSSPYQTGELNGHAAYPSVYNSILDYADWQRIRITAYEKKYNIKITTDEQYMHMLNHVVIGNGVYRYAEDLNYTDKLKRLSIK
jgi:hypothetical protein